jgi:Mn-dependent DtxR family transcriptional regulator
MRRWRGFCASIGSSNPLEEAELIEHSLSLATVSDLEDLLAFFRSDAAYRAGFEHFKNKRKNKL